MWYLVALAILVYGYFYWTADRIVWQHPDKLGYMTDGYREANSKGLDPQSSLYKKLMAKREKLQLYCQTNNIELHDSRPLHIELCRPREKGNRTQVVEKRAKDLSGVRVYLKEENYGRCGCAFAFYPTYDYHITLIALKNKHQLPLHLFRFYKLVA